MPNVAWTFLGGIGGYKLWYPENRGFVDQKAVAIESSSGELVYARHLPISNRADKTLFSKLCQHEFLKKE